MAKKRVVLYVSDNIMSNVEEKINDIRTKYGVVTTPSQIIGSDLEELYGSKTEIE